MRVWYIQVFIFAALLFQPYAYAKEGSSQSQKNVDLVWKARGLQAFDRIEELQKKNGNSRGKALSKLETCEWALERAFMPFASPELSKIVRKKSGPADAYILLFSGGDGNMTQVSYLYGASQFKPLAVKVPALAKDWQVIMLPDGVFAVSGDGCQFTFSMTDPLQITSDVWK